MAKPGRNDPCPCGSGRKYKKCCEAGARSGSARGRWLIIAVAGATIAAIIIGVVSFTAERTTGGTRVWSPDHGHYHDASSTEVP